MLDRLGIKSKLLLMLLGVSLGSVAVVSAVSFVASRDALSDNVTDQLTATRETLSRQVEDFFRTIEGQVASLAESAATVQALAEFRVGWDQLADAPLDDRAADEITAAYEEFVASLPRASRVDSPAALQPTAANARYLQYRYAVAGDVEDRSDVVSVDDGTFYSRAHARYHPALRNYIDRFGYADLFLVDAETGTILYSVRKQLDFGTSLVSGPYRHSNLARLLDRLRSDPEPGRVAFTDYEFSVPSRYAPAAFVASPVVNRTDGAVVGIVAMKLPIDEIDRVMTAAGDWQASGFGATGEAYLVGPDLTMRSQARPLVETPADYLTAIRQDGLPPETVALMHRYRSSVLLQPVETVAARAAIEGTTGTRIVRDYRGVETLASYAPLDLPDLRWGIVTQFDLSEATAPVLDLQRSLLVAAGVIVLLVTGLTMLLASVFVRPVERLTAWAGRIQRGDLTPLDGDHGRDEFGHLFEAFGEMVDALRSQREVAERQAAENEELLETLLPGVIAERLRAGEETIADDYTNVAVIDARLSGLTELTTTATAEAAASILNDIAYRVEETLDHHGVEKVRSIGTRYLAACGLLHPRLDYRRRAVEFAIELRETIRQYAIESGLDLGVRIAITAGEVEAGVIGRAQPVFVIWGSTVSLAEALSAAAAPDEIVTTTEVARHLADYFEFVQRPVIDVPGEHRRLVGTRGRESDRDTPATGDVPDRVRASTRDGDRDTPASEDVGIAIDLTAPTVADPQDGSR